MSARKRRIKRKIAMLVRMDAQSKRMPPGGQAVFWVRAIAPLSIWIGHRGYGWRLITAVFARIGDRGAV